MAKDPSVGWTLSELASLLGGVCDGPEDLVIKRPAPAGSSDPLGLSFAETENYLRLVAQGGVGAVLAHKDADTLGVPAIRVESPRQAFGMFLTVCHRPLPIEVGIHPTAIVSADAQIGEGACIGPYAVVERGASIGDRSRIFAFCYIGENCAVGQDALIYPHAVLYQDVTIGDRTIVHAGAILGADGFGFVWDGRVQRKVAQVGRVELGADVEVGANTAIDRATAGSTLVGRGSKLDNLVMIGHNCSIGEHTVIAGLCGISGSTTIGDRVTLAGQVGTSDHVTIASDVTLGGRTGVMTDIKNAGVYWGTPAKPYPQAVKIAAINQKAPEMFERLRELEKRIQHLENSKG